MFYKEHISFVYLNRSISWSLKKNFAFDIFIIQGSEIKNVHIIDNWSFHIHKILFSLFIPFFLKSK